jgi:hypothetical protein
MIYAYAIAAEIGNVVDLDGVQGEPLLAVPLRSARVLCGKVNAAPMLDRAVLTAQDTLIRALHARSTALLPMRFGTTAADIDVLREKILAIDGLLERLEAVRGCEQMTVRVAGAGGTIQERSEPPVSGTEYLQAKAQRRTPRELRLIAEAAGPLQRDVRYETAGQPGLIGSVYHLIERGHADAYRAAIERAASNAPELSVLVTGPSPAYAFA